MKYANLLYLFIVISLNSCNTEYKIYKRVGGNHLSIKSGDKELFWFSGMHGSDPNNPMFKDIYNELKKFDPELILVEGNANYNIPVDSSSAIKEGESVYVAYLAGQRMIPCQGTEPPDSSLNNYLMKKYRKEDILSMYIIRQMVQWGREKKLDPNFNERIVSFTNSINNELHYSDTDLSLTQISLLLKPYTDIDELNNETWHNFDAKKYIYYSANIISEIYNLTYKFRNIYLVDLINDMFKSYNKIFVMMGFDHAKEIEKELREVMKYV